MGEGKLLLLFDGNAIVHRAHHAFAQSPLTVGRTGELVSAVYGFASMLLKVVWELKPSHWAVAMDYPAPTFRHREYAEYKAQRPPTPEELKGQFARIRELVGVFHIPIYEVEGYEADDLLGTLSRQGAEQGIESIIVTGDSDTMQLVSPQVRVLYPRPGRTFSDTELYDEAKVKEKFGLPPTQLPDLKGLKGDATDNIPGVSGVGDKTAVKLLQQFGGIDGIYQHLSELNPPRLRELLRLGEAQARQSKALGTIVTQAPVELDLEKCAVTGYDRAKVVELFRGLGFQSLLAKLPEGLGEGGGAARPRRAAPPPAEYLTITSLPALEDMLSHLSPSPYLSVDVETTGKEEKVAELVGISLSPHPGLAYYLPVGHHWAEQLPLPLVLERLRHLLTAPSLPKVAHNGKYDMTVLARYGLLVEPLTFDTMVAAHLLGEKSLGLKALAFTKLSIEMTPISDLIGTGPKQLTMAQVPVDKAAKYACADADMTLRLKAALEGELEQEGLRKLFEEVEMPLLPVLLSMEQAGVLLDRELLSGLARALTQEVARLEGAIYEAVGHQFNINSSPQLAQVLYEELHLPHSRRTKTGYSTEASVLEELKEAHPAIPLILEYRQLIKLKSTYVDALPALLNPRTGRVHTTFNQTGTSTGRLSSSDPNLQNIPVRGEWGKKIRRAFVAPPGEVLVSGDYSQIDLRALAHLSRDPTLVEAFLRDEDIHATTAAQVFAVPLSQVTPEMRRVAKTVNFGVIYGMSGYGLEQATELSRAEAEAFIRSYFERYPGVRAYLEATKEQARSQGYVETVLGRRRYIPEINSTNNQMRGAAERMAINMPVQGTSADIMKIAMIDLHREGQRRGLRSRMVLQVHDELVFETPQEEREELTHLLTEVMPRAMSLAVPLKAEVKSGPNWGEME